MLRESALLGGPRNVDLHFSRAHQQLRGFILARTSVGLEVVDELDLFIKFELEQAPVCNPLVRTIIVGVVIAPIGWQRCETAMVPKSLVREKVPSAKKGSLERAASLRPS